MKISYNKWLSKKINYSNLLNHHFILKIFLRLIEWIENNEELKLKYDKYTIFKKFSKFLYNEYLYPINYVYSINNDEINENYEIYNLRYSDSIIILYNYFKEYSNSLNINLFNNKNNTAYPMIEFIYSICNYNIDEYISEEEENNDDIIDIY